jgi:N-acetylneuraminic acid mutarotase
MKKFKSTIALILFLSFVLSAFSIPLVRASEDSWTSKAPMQEARAGLGVAVVNGRIYAIGGCNSQIDGQTHFYGTINATEEYDPATNSWTEKAQMPTPRASFAIAVYENKIYVIGGYIKLTSGSSSQLINITEVYDPVTDTWETRASMPAARDGVEANVIDGKIYVIGGINADGVTNVTEVYDPATDMWETKTPIPTPVSHYASAVVDNKIYVISGRIGDDAVTDLTQIYDTETDMWSSGASIRTGVGSAAAGATTGVLAPKAIYVIGGKFASEPLYAQNIVQAYSPENDSWSIGASMPADRADLGVAVVNDALYAIGGGRSILQADSTDVWQYTPIGYIPEFPSWIILPLLLTAALAIMVSKQRLTKNR